MAQLPKGYENDRNYIIAHQTKLIQKQLTLLQTENCEQKEQRNQDNIRIHSGHVIICLFQRFFYDFRAFPNVSEDRPKIIRPFPMICRRLPRKIRSFIDQHFIGYDVNDVFTREDSLSCLSSGSASARLLAPVLPSWFGFFRSLA